MGLVKALEPRKHWESIKMEYDIQIDFQLLGTEKLPEDISKKIGICPDVEMLKGVRNEELVLPRANIWAIRSQAKSDEVADHWHELEKKLTNSDGVIKDIARSGVAKLTIIINSNKRVPSIIIPVSMSRFAGFIEAIIDVDHL